jgi:ABC-2 type transport system permease protein
MMTRNVWLVVWHDVGVVLGQRTFWLFSLLAPCLLLAYLSYDAIRDAGQSGAAEPAAPAAEASQRDLPPIGLVDEAGLIVAAPPGLTLDRLVRYADLEAAQAALTSGEIEQIVVIPDDYLARGSVTVYDLDVQIRQSGTGMGVGYGSDQTWVLMSVIDYNLARDPQRLALLRDPTTGPGTTWHQTDPPPLQPAGSTFTQEWVGNLVPFIVYFLLVLTGSYLIRSVIAEKENRTAEVVLSSICPRDLMLGKLGAAAVLLVLQLVIWLAGAGVVVRLMGASVSLEALALPPGFWVLVAVYLGLDYLLCASLMLAAGAFASNAREVGQVIWLLVVPLMPAMMFAPELREQPDSALTLILTLFPLSAPAAIITRLAVGQVPAWQLAVSLIGLLVATGLTLTWAARLFRADNLLSLDPFRWRRLLGLGASADQ